MGTTVEKLQKALDNKANIKQALDARRFKDVGENQSTWASEITAIEPPLDTIEIARNGTHDIKDYKNAHVMVLSNADIILKQIIEGTVTGIEIPASVTKVRDYFLYMFKIDFTFEDKNSIIEIGNNSFYNAQANKNKPLELDLPNCETIGESAFYGIVKKIINLPKCKTIGTNAFGRATEYNYQKYDITLDLPNCETVKTNAFNSNVLLGGYGLIINLPKCTTLEQNVFRANNIKSAYIPLIENVPNSLFETGGYCQGFLNPILKIVDIFPSCKTIGNNAFQNNTLIEEVYIPNDCTSIGGNVFYGCTKLKKIILNDKLQTIGGYLFYNSLVDNITIPKSVTSIGGTFYGKNKVTYRFLSDTPCTIASGTFNKSYLNKIYVPLGRSALYKSATNWSSFADYIVEPNNVTINVPSTILNNENIIYSLDSGKTYQQFTSETLSLNEIGSINFKSLTADTTILIGTTAGGNDIGTIANSELIYSTSGDTTIYLTIQ